MTLHEKMAIPDLQRYPCDLQIYSGTLDLQIYNGTLVIYRFTAVPLIYRFTAVPLWFTDLQRYPWFTDLQRYPWFTDLQRYPWKLFRYIMLLLNKKLLEITLTVSLIGPKRWPIWKIGNNASGLKNYQESFQIKHGRGW